MGSALFFDVDGTLVDSYHGNREISGALAAELARVKGLGHRLFLSSGRPRQLLDDRLLGVGFDGLVLINGGYVEMAGQPLYEERMGADLARATVEFLEDEGCQYLVICAERSYTSPTFDEVLAFFCDDLGMFEFAYDREDVFERAIKCEAMVPIEDRARVTARVAEALGDKISCDGHGGAGTYELFPTAISKAKGIACVLDHLGLDRTQAYGFGDGTNDLEMIRYCGCGVAMGNAEDAVKAEADLVCGPVWEDGLAQVLRELF